MSFTIKQFPYLAVKAIKMIDANRVFDVDIEGDKVFKACRRVLTFV